MTTPGHSQQEPPAAAPLTASATLRLVTPAALAEGLLLFGLRWQPEPFDAAAADTASGMYAWVIPGQPADLLHCPAIYLGIGEGAGGWRARVRKEENWRSGDHAHGIAIRRAGATVVGGPVNHTAAPLDWTRGIVSDEGVTILDAYVDEQVAESPLSTAEAIAIRMGIHLGDTGLPVNSTHGGAWNNQGGHDWAGYAAARKVRMLRGEDLH